MMYQSKKQKRGRTWAGTINLRRKKKTLVKTLTTLTWEEAVTLVLGGLF